MIINKLLIPLIASFSGATFLVVIICFVILYRHVSRQFNTYEILSKKVARLEELNNGIVEQLAILENRHNHPIYDQETDFEDQSEDSSEQPTFNQAILLAKKGAHLDEITDKCNLSKGEAELILNLHGQKKPKNHKSAMPLSKQ